MLNLTAHTYDRI